MNVVRRRLNEPGLEVVYPKTSAPRTVQAKGKPGQALTAAVTAVPGATLDATIELVKGYAAPPAPPALIVIGPGGQPLDVGPYVTSEPGFVHLAELPLDEVGAYRLEFPAGPSGKSKVRFHLAPVQPPSGSTFVVD